jgi:hypothetical protein
MHEFLKFQILKFQIPRFSGILKTGLSGKWEVGSGKREDFNFTLKNVIARRYDEGIFKSFNF